MSMELSFTVVSEKEVGSYINPNEFALHSQSKMKCFVQEEGIQLCKRDESATTSSIDIPIYESVQAVLRREIYELLKLEVDNKLLLNMKNYAEPFEISELENGHLTFTGTLKAILLCQQILYSFLKNSRFYVNQNKKDNAMKELHQNPVFNEVEEDHHICRVSLPENTESEIKNKSAIPKVSSIITIPQNSNSQTSIKSKLVSNDFRSEKDYKFCKSHIKEDGSDIANEFSVGQQKLCVGPLCDSESAAANLCIEEATTFHEPTFTSSDSSISKVECVPSTQNVQNLRFLNDACSFRCQKQSQFVKNQNCHEKTSCLQLSGDIEIQKKPSSHSKSSLKAFRRPNALKLDCKICDGIFESSTVLQQHACNNESFEEKQSKIPVNKKFTCEVCSFKARHRREYKLHLENAHPIAYSCSQCSYRTTKKVHYIRHVRNVHENRRPYCCQLCGVAFKRRDALKQHQVVHFKDSSSLADTDANSLFKCRVCKKIVRSAAYLREHMLTHSEERSFLCEVCGASFKTRAVHRNHLKVVHSQGARAICRYCGKTFATKYSLKRHTRQHETRGRKQNGKIRLWKKQPSSEAGWVPLLLGSDLLTSGSSVPIAVAEKEEIVSLTRSDCIASMGPSSRNDKLIPSIYTESTNSESFGITIDSQIPYVIHSTQEITSD